MKKLKLVYETEDEVPAEHKELYEEKDGKWHFGAIDGLKTQTDVANVQTALTKERKLRTEAESKVKKFERLADKDPDELLRAVEEAEELRTRIEELESGGAQKPDVKAQVDAAVERAKKQWQRDLDKEKKDHGTTKALLEEEQKKVLKIDNAMKTAAIRQTLSEAAIAAKVHGKAIGDVLMFAGNFEAEIDEVTGKAIVRTKDGVGITPGLDPAAWLQDQKENKPHWWETSVGGGARGTGGTTNGAGGPNPFDKKSPNITEAQLLIRKDPQKAEQLAKLAGYKSAIDAAAAMGAAAARAPAPR